MQPTITPEPQPKRHIILKIVIALIVLVIVGVVVFMVSRGIQQTNLENDVKTELIKQNKLIKQSSKNGVFPASFPAGIGTTDKVIIKATLSGSGTTYCIDGTHKKDNKVIYHMDKTTPEDAPLKGSCSDSTTSVPVVPTDVAIGSTGAGVINMTWSEAPYAASYIVQCATDKDFVTGLQSATVSGATATLSGLGGNVQYYCRVAANNSLGHSEWSATVTGIPAATSVAPTDLKVTTVSQTELSYSWKPVDGASSYILEYTPDIGFNSGIVTINTTATSGSVKGLKTFTAYYFHVKAVTPGFDAARAAFSGMVLGRTAE